MLFTFARVDVLLTLLRVLVPVLATDWRVLVVPVAETRVERAAAVLLLP